MRGSAHNDMFKIDETGKMVTLTNYSGGVQVPPYPPMCVRAPQLRETASSVCERLASAPASAAGLCFCHACILHQELPPHVSIACPSRLSVSVSLSATGGGG